MGIRSSTAALAALVVLAACGDAAPAADEDAAETTEAAVPAPPPPPSGERGFEAEKTGGVAGVLADNGDAELLAVTLTEWGVELSRDSIGGGPVTLVIENKGERTHTLEVRSEHYGRWRSAPIPPGGSASMSMPLQFATYEVFCPTTDESGDHREKGMHATLRVQ